MTFTFFNIDRFAYRLLLMLLCFTTYTSVLCAQQTTAIPGNIVKMLQYNKEAKKMLDQLKYDESIGLAELALQQKENPTSYCYLCHINSMQKNWDEAIKCGEKALKLDSNTSAVYFDLFYAYKAARKYDEAISISSYVKRFNPSWNIDEETGNIQNSINQEDLSTFFIGLFLVVLVTGFALFLYRHSKKGTNSPPPGNEVQFREVLLVAASVSCVLWVIFYAFSPIIWSFSPHIQSYGINPLIEPYIYEHDGVESFVLYIMMFVNAVATLLTTRLLLKIRSRNTLYVYACAALCLLSGYYFYQTGFFPPIVTLKNFDNIIFPIFLAALGTGIYFLYLKNPLTARLIILFISAFSALLSFCPTSTLDLEYILAPALRLLHGFKISEIYFQYDLLLSFVAELWMKCGIPVESFPYVANISYFLFFIGSFIFAERFFKTKGLSSVFILAIIAVRLYAQGYYSPSVFQVNPLRLDLWLIPLFIASRLGARHWGVGLSLSLLVLFHRNLGLIYLVSYGELLAILFLADLMAELPQRKINYKTVAEMAVKHLGLNLINIIILSAAVTSCFVLFHGFFSQTALLYRKLGIGMIPISKLSFYWYVPLALSSAGTFLFLYRTKLDSRYLSTGLFMVLLAIGSSLYFFGRSHENNILNIGGMLVFVVFLLFDMLISFGPKHTTAPMQTDQPTAKVAKTKPHATYNVYMCLPVFFLLLVGYFYSDRITEKVGIQFSNLQKGIFCYPLKPEPVDTASVRQITQNSKKVYFLDFWNDFFYYYYGNYVPLGYFNPPIACIYNKDLVAYMQQLLNEGYYVVYDFRKNDALGEFTGKLDFNKTAHEKYMISLKKEDVKMLFPETPDQQYHVAIKDQLDLIGLDHKGIDLNDNFTIEAIIKPAAGNAANAVIFYNVSKADEEAGFALQCNGSIPDNYIFGFFNGSPTMPFAAFNMESNKWNYVVIMVSKATLRVYKNGKLNFITNTGGLPYVNSLSALIVGNNTEHNSPFKGVIRELKISNNLLSEQQIMLTAQKLDTALTAEDNYKTSK